VVVREELGAGVCISAGSRPVMDQAGRVDSV
jgi:hypothetical protein